MKTMNQNFYPVFKANQVLTHNDLNNSFKYLNEQVALTRANLVGTGIVCGLNVFLDKEEGKIHISKGCGITSGKVRPRPVSKERTSYDINSGGHYIALEKDTVYGYYKRIECDCLSGSILSGREIYELADISPNDRSTSEGVEYTKININDSLFSKQPIVILCYESKEYSQLCGSCGGQSYTSPDKVITIRPLLIVTPVETPTGDTDVLNFISPLQRLNVEGSSVADIYIGIRESLENHLNNINEELTKAKRIFQETLKANAPSGISEKIIKAETDINQNHYDFISDLTEAYEEFRQYGEKFLLTQRLSEEEFPCYLILNGRYRHYFRPAIATASDDYAELNRLWERLVTMIEYFNPDIFETPAVTNIRLTPSIYGAVPLSEKTVPYYYKKTDVADRSENQKALDEMHKAWTDRKNQVGYWYDWYNKSDTNYLKYDLERYNFVRIEGHIDQLYTYNDQNNHKTTIKNAIKKIADDCHLPIKVIAFKNVADGTATCDLKSQEKYFLILRSDIQNSAYAVIHKIASEGDAAAINDLNYAVRAVQSKAIKAAEAATAAAEAATAAAGNDPAKKEAAANAANAANAAKAAANSVALDKADEAKKAADEAKKAADEVTKVSASIDVNSITDLANITITASAALIAAIAIDNKDLSSYLTEDYKISKDVESSFGEDKELFELHLKIILFLQWLDTTQMIHQQCEAKNVFSSFGSFKEKHPGLQHKSGVPIGGTFILVYNENNTVIADFCLPYRVTQPD